MKTYSSVKTLVLMLFLSVASSVVSASDYKIEKIQGDIYRFVDDRHRSVFLVTDEGILLTDPLNTQAAT